MTSPPASPRTLAEPVSWKEDACVLLDQRRLPGEERYFSCRDHEAVVIAIRELAVRGAPAIGVAGAYAVVLAARQYFDGGKGTEARWGTFLGALDKIAAARPTAVNLGWAVARMRRVAEGARGTAGITGRMLTEARAIHDEEVAANSRIGALGAVLLPDRGDVMTYCNAGTLATVGIGTALGVVHEGFRRGKVQHVWVCETRPVLQGLRLTTWELHRAGIPFTVICDNMAAAVMRSRPVGAVVTGADRIAANGDVANKIGTYSLAVLARHHRIPLFVAAPVSTFDLSLGSGEIIPIEERSSHELLTALGDNRPPFPMPVFNPAFDVTPRDLVTAIICEKGVAQPVGEAAIAGVLRG